MLRAVRPQAPDVVLPFSQHTFLWTSVETKPSGCLPDFPCTISNLIWLAHCVLKNSFPLKGHWETGKGPCVTFWLATTISLCLWRGAHG